MYLRHDFLKIKNYFSSQTLRTLPPLGTLSCFPPTMTPLCVCVCVCVCWLSTLPVNNWWVSIGRSSRSSRPLSRSCTVAFPGLRCCHSRNILYFCMATFLSSALMKSRSSFFSLRWMATCSHFRPSVSATFRSCSSERSRPTERVSLYLSGKKTNTIHTQAGQVPPIKMMDHSTKMLILSL